MLRNDVLLNLNDVVCLIRLRLLGLNVRIMCGRLRMGSLISARLRLGSKIRSLNIRC